MYRKVCNDRTEAALIYLPPAKPPNPEHLPSPQHPPLLYQPSTLTHHPSLFTPHTAPHTLPDTRLTEFQRRDIIDGERIASALALDLDAMMMAVSAAELVEMLSNDVALANCHWAARCQLLANVGRHRGSAVI